MIEQGEWLTSKWEWRYPRCLGWPAKETRLPARHPPLKKPWCRCAHSLRPHHSPHFYYLHQTDTNRISTWKHHSVALPMTTRVRVCTWNETKTLAGCITRGRTTRAVRWNDHAQNSRIYPLKKWQPSNIMTRLISRVHHGLL